MYRKSIFCPSSIEKYKNIFEFLYAYELIEFFSYSFLELPTDRYVDFLADKVNSLDSTSVSGGKIARRKLLAQIVARNFIFSLNPIIHFVTLPI